MKHQARSVDNVYGVPSPLLAFLSGVFLRYLINDSTLLGHRREDGQTWRIFGNQPMKWTAQVLRMFYMNRLQLWTGVSRISTLLPEVEIRM
jgi:hypothetical protein